MSDKYIVITQHAAWNHDEGSHEIVYRSDLEEFDSRMDAINHGIDITDSDDFNIGTLRNGKLAAFNWMEKPVKGHDLSDVSEQIGLEGGDHA